MAERCLIGTKPGETKAYWRDIEKDEWKNFAADQRNSQVQVLKDNGILFFRVIPDDKSAEHKIPVHNGIAIYRIPSGPCVQLGVEEKIFLLKFKTEDEANDFATRADALKELKPLPPPVRMPNPSKDQGPMSPEPGAPYGVREPGAPYGVREPGARGVPRNGYQPEGVPQPNSPVDRRPQAQPEPPRAKVPTADKQPNPSGMKPLIIENPEVIARQLALALNQNSIEKALQCIDSIGVLKKPDVKFQITYAVDERVAKPSINATINIEFQSQKKPLKVFLEVDESYTFATMQQMIEDTYRIPCAAQKWIVGDKLISNDTAEKKLLDFGITNAIEDVTLFMYVMSLNRPGQPRVGTAQQQPPVVRQPARNPGYNNRGYGQKPDWSVDPAPFGRPIPHQPQQSYPSWQYEGRQQQYQQQFRDRPYQDRPYQDRDGNSYQPYDMRGRGFEASDNYRGRDVWGREPERADPRFADGFQRREAWAQRSGDYPQMNQGREERGTPSMSREQ